MGGWNIFAGNACMCHLIRGPPPYLTYLTICSLFLSLSVCRAANATSGPDPFCFQDLPDPSWYPTCWHHLEILHCRWGWPYMNSLNIHVETVKMALDYWNKHCTPLTMNSLTLKSPSVKLQQNRLTVKTIVNFVLHNCVVVVDKFACWVETSPTKIGSAMHAAKSLGLRFLPHWEMPECIHTVPRTHFTGQVAQEVMKMLNIQWKLYCPYRSQGKLNIKIILRNNDSQSYTSVGCNGWIHFQLFFAAFSPCPQEMSS